MNVFAEMFLDAPAAPITIWAVLMVLSLPALLVLASPQAVRDPLRAATETFGFLRRYRQEREQRQEEAVAAVRYAGEIAVAADRAGVAAQRWHECWRQADEHASLAWQRWQDAEQQLTRVRAGAAFRPAWSSRTPSEYADRESFLLRTVGAAVSRGDLPADALTGFDPRLHPVEQELAVQRAIVAHRWELHLRAQEAEKAAWHDSQLATATRDSLRRETGEAAAQAAALYRHLPRRDSRVVQARGFGWAARTA
ncbi:hypothetical protein ACTI_51660 [Actinoplanes sp. OR16]|uniref:hypothetical protein n=1 Tax=Actinoplanes sp. OR16 TaxID=946334 RepID=UPI000F6DDF37|nr:hypothetical protein [Actinoplanes sp. OR16]BBH68481.1 hypothetical protein ACTI_51660 [Actinoplanes sp. OR16]